MTTDTALIEKREELKRRLATGEYKTLVDVFLNWVNRVIQKITRQTKPLPNWIIVITLSLAMLLIGLGLTYVAGDWTSLRIVEFYGLGYGLGLLLLILSVVFLIASVVAINESIIRIRILWRDSILDATESLTSLLRFEDWLEKACNRRLHFLFTIFVSLLGGFYVESIASNLLGSFVGYGSAFTIIIGNMFSAAFFYLFGIVLLFPTVLRRYDLRLFVADPSSSELISRLSSELGFFVYIVAVFAALNTLSNASLGILQNTGIVLVLFLWLPIIAIFTLNQTSLSSVIGRAKWKTLNDIQARVEKLQEQENYSNKETMEAINRLMDYHDRVKATRDSALDFRTYLSFFNSLLLPLLAFILGNLDLVLNLFGRTP